MKNFKLFCISIILISFFNELEAQNTNTFNLNSSHDYPTYLDISFTDKGRSLGDDFASSYVRNYSNATISFGIEFTINDYCGNSRIVYWPGGLILEPGASENEIYALAASCKELKSNGDKKFGISSVYCRVISFKNLTEEENRIKEERDKKEKEQQVLKEKKEKEKIAKQEAENKEREDNLRKEKENKEKQELESKIAKEENTKREDRVELNEDEVKKSEELKKIEQERIERTKKNQNVESDKKVEKQKTDAEIEAARLEFERRQKESQAKALEAEGDTFYSLGSIFINSALEKYNQAQLIYYSAAVQVKIDKINGIKAAVNLVNEGMEKVDEFLSDTQQTFDDAGWPRWRVASFSYEALAPSFKGFETQKVIVPKAYSISYGFYRLLALEVGLKYQESPVYKFGLEDNNGQYIGKDVEASNTTLGPELLLGLGGGSKNLAFYVMYGYYFPFVLSGTSYTTGYEYRGDFKDAFGTTPISKLKAGIFYRIPKTTIGIGVYYCMNGVNGEKLLEGSLVDVIDRSRGLEDIYGLGPGNNSSLDRLKYNSIGFSFIIKNR